MRTGPVRRCRMGYGDVAAQQVGIAASIMHVSGRPESTLTTGPVVNSLERTPHEHRPVAVGQTPGLDEWADALLIAQHPTRPRPIGSPHAAVDAEGVDNPEDRFPDVVVGIGFARQ